MDSAKKNSETDAQFYVLSTERDSLDKSIKQIEDELKKYPRNSMGLTPDAAKDAHWHDLNQQFARLFRKLREVNTTLVKHHGKALRDQRAARRGA
jgi:uncharacterized protein YdcH (DUF465 family)